MGHPPSGSRRGRVGQQSLFGQPGIDFGLEFVFTAVIHDDGMGLAFLDLCRELSGLATGEFGIIPATPFP
jgi:hypothetical protein